MKGYVLVVDDDASLRRALRDRLAHWGLDVEEAANGVAALKAAAKREYDIVILDLNMPEVGGMEVLARWQEEDYGASVLVLTAHGSIDAAIEAVRAGAADFLQKPADFDLLQARLGQLLKSRSQGRMVQALSERVSDDGASVIGHAPAMVQLLETAARAARSDATVLITGESGSGKQVLAEYVHASSPRSAGPFVYVNCVAMSDDLVESTLFGHERGAFTGAVAMKQGRIELAAGGTAFLDEIGDTSARLQTKLLHFLESSEYERVGGTRTLTADCRIVAATNRDLPAEISRGAFREDLYFRLNVIHLELPPLRERREDVPDLASAFASRFASELKRGPMEIAPETMERLRAYAWPGNVRQLKNLIERMVVLAPESTLTPDLLPSDFFGGSASADGLEEGTLPYKEAIQAFKRSYIAKALARADGNQTKAAELLGMQRTFLNRLVREMGLRDADPS
jgi:DNA-binding NtrC family response regulator